MRAILSIRGRWWIKQPGVVGGTSYTIKEVDERKAQKPSLTFKGKRKNEREQLIIEFDIEKSC